MENVLSLIFVCEAATHWPANKFRKKEEYQGP